MNPHLKLLFAAALFTAAASGAGMPPEKIWQTAPARLSPPPTTNRFFVPPELAQVADWNISFTTRSGETWLGGGTHLAWHHRGQWKVFASTNQLGPEQPVGLAEISDGRIWCATPGQVWEFDGRDWLAARLVAGPIHSLAATRDGTLWIASAHGLLRFARGTWIVNDLADGLPAEDVFSVQEDENGSIFAETALGWSRFEPDADTDAPRTEILSPEFNPANVPEDAAITLRFRGSDPREQTAASDLIFSCRLDEHTWSSFQPAAPVVYSGLGLGRHVFRVRSMDRNGNREAIPAQLEFTVVVPWYREARLVLVLAAALLVSLFFAALALNRHRHLRHSYAQVGELVAERTGQLELANRELFHSQKMNALGTLAAGIAHDFNNILSIVKGSAQIIEDNLADPEKIRTRTARIQTVVQQGAEVVDALLGFSRGDGAPAALCDLNAVLADTRRLLGDRFLHEVEVRFEPDASLPEISAPRDFIQQILLNFIFNADEAMTGRKRIEISTRLAEKLPEELFLAPAPAPKFIFISVHDHGPGIAPEIRARIFEPFFTTKNLSARRGTGLGLSMVYELAKKMNAGLAVESAPDAGSTFTLILPVKS